MAVAFKLRQSLVLLGARQMGHLLANVGESDQRG